MKILRILAVMALVAVAVAGGRPAMAQDNSPEALAAARELVSLTSKDTIRQMATQMIGQLWPTVERSLRAKQPTLTVEQVTALRQEYERIFVEYLNGLMDDAPTLYVHYFSADELRQLVAFYRSPVGQKALHVLPQLTVEMFKTMMPRVQEMQVKIDAAFTKILAERGLQK
jgi:hypothetical protein